MQDYWNDPPEYDELPDWFAMLEEACEEPSMPEAVEKAVRDALDKWCAEENARYDIEPVDFGELPNNNDN